jgi:myo-inositol 2-dehydrogenase/D-chiro-inositol 1-dehydrogenase
MNRPVRVGVIGSQFISHIHTLSLKRCPQAEVFAIASPTPGNAQKFALKNEIPHHFTDYRNCSRCRRWT